MENVNESSEIVNDADLKVEDPKNLQEVINGDKVASAKNDTATAKVCVSTTSNVGLNSSVSESSSSDNQTKTENQSKGRKRKASEAKFGEEPNKKDVYQRREEIVDKKAAKQSETDTRTEAISDLQVPPKETPELNLGKGKRARIPNKRYSDIMLSPQTRLSKHSIENGERADDIEDDALRINSAPAAKKQKLVDITNPNFLKPFKYGWKRELVYRANFDSNNKRVPGDIYYYSPQGKKIRSMRELSELLKTKDLTLEDFTFIKEPLGLDDPEKEIIRDAKTWQKKALQKGAKSPKVLSPKLQTPKKTGAESPKVNVSSVKNSSFSKIKIQTKSSTKKSRNDDENVEVDPSPNVRPKRKAAKATKSTMDLSKSKKRIPQRHQQKSSDEKSINFMSDNYLQALSYGYKTLLHIFQYLKVQDILRASCVCHMWHDIASHSSLWKTVRMKNSQVHSFDGLAKSLKKHGTIHLDLRKMLLPAHGGDEIWIEFSRAIQMVDTLRKIELCRCPASVVEQLPQTNSNLEVINAVTIKCETMNLNPLNALKNLKELRLKSTNGLSLTSDLGALEELINLKHLSLTSIKNFDQINLNVIGSLKNLESLDLGECTNFPKNFGDEILIKLEKLEKLRLEKGQDNCYTFEILDAVSKMKQLEQLELVNFDIKVGFDVALGNCSNIKKLLLIPTYISQSATTNHMVLGGVLRLKNTLNYFVWGVTLELLRVTELFVDQCEDPDKKDNKKEKKGNGDSIPVLKPVPLIQKDDEIPPADDPPQVEILPLPNLQKMLLQSLPTTRVKILKIPFHATWRQSINDTVNA